VKGKVFKENERKYKNRMTSPTQSLCKIFGPGMTWGMYNAGRGLFVHVTATLSADIPSIDAQLYHLVLER